MLLLLKKHLLPMILKDLIIQKLMQMLLILQMIMRLVEKKKLAFKNNAPFINCFSRINGIKINNAEDLDVKMPMYSLLEYSKSHKKTTGSL